MYRIHYVVLLLIISKNIINHYFSERFLENAINLDYIFSLLSAVSAFSTSFNLFYIHDTLLIFKEKRESDYQRDYQLNSYFVVYQSTVHAVAYIGNAPTQINFYISH